MLYYRLDRPVTICSAWTLQLIFHQLYRTPKARFIQASIHPHSSVRNPIKITNTHCANRTIGAKLSLAANSSPRFVFVVCTRVKNITPPGCPLMCSVHMAGSNGKLNWLLAVNILNDAYITRGV